MYPQSDFTRGCIPRGTDLLALDGDVVHPPEDVAHDDPPACQTLFVADKLYIENRPSLFGPVDPSFRALSGRLKFTVRSHKFDKDSLSCFRPKSGYTCARSESAREGGVQRPRSHINLRHACERCTQGQISDIFTQVSTSSKTLVPQPTAHEYRGTLFIRNTHPPRITIGP